MQHVLIAMAVIGFIFGCIAFIYTCHRVMRFFEGLHDLMVKQIEMMGELREQMAKLERNGYYVNVPGD